MCNHTLRRRIKATKASPQASGTQEACFTWIFSECKLRSKQMFYSVIALHHAFASKIKKGDMFNGQSDNKDRKPVMNYILNDKETVKLEAFCLR